MDFIEGLPRVHGKSVILTVVDRFPSTPISLHSVTHTRLHLWLRLSSKLLFALMGFQLLL
jgi:hypothetical protein